MKHLALLLVVAVVACKSDKPPAPAPTPTETGSGSGSTVIAAGSGSSTTDVGSAGSGSAACVIKVTLNPTNVAWDGGGVKGQSDFKAGESPHLDALKGITNCSAWLVADDAMIYQDVIAVMDALVKLGITDVSLGDPTKSKPTSIPTPGVTKKPLTGVVGLPLSGRITSDDVLKKAPVLIITKTEVRLHDKVVGKPDDAEIATKLAAVLPKDPSDPTFIVQADKDTSAKTINRVITAASNQGYTNVLFAVKNK
jgi:biopolymer transport protein ExbD